jgi:hypothetical protein
MRGGSVDILNLHKATVRIPSVVGSGLLILAMMTVGACGSQSSNSSLQKYSKLRKTLGPVHNSPTPTQTYVPTDLFLLEVDPSTPTNFTVGQKNVLRFRTALNLKGTKYRLVSRDLPRGSEPLKDLGQGIWELAWTPSQELIPHNVNEPIRGGFHIALDIYEVTDLQSKNLVQTLATEREVHYSLLRSGLAPEITEFGGIAPYPQVTKLNEGDVLNLVITVKDPASSPMQKPKLLPIVVPNRITKEQRVISGHGFLFLDTEPTMVQPGVWQFKAFFDTKNNSVPEYNIEGKPSLAPNILADLSLQVLSANRTLSAEKTLTFEITYRRELLKPAFRANPEIQPVNQNSTWTYSFESYLPSVVGTMTTYLSEETVKLPGTPKMTCKHGKKESAQQSCKIDWKVSCSVAPGDVTIKVIAAAEYQGQNTSTELQKKLTISENKKCSKPAPEVKSVPSDKTTDPSTPKIEPKTLAPKAAAPKSTTPKGTSTKSKTPTKKTKKPTTTQKPSTSGGSK